MIERLERELQALKKQQLRVLYHSDEWIRLYGRQQRIQGALAALKGEVV